MDIRYTLMYRIQIHKLAFAKKKKGVCATLRSRLIAGRYVPRGRTN